MKYNKYVPTGIDVRDSFKAEKKRAETAVSELLICQPKKVRDTFINKIHNANTSGEISRYLVEVRELI